MKAVVLEQIDQPLAISSVEPVGLGTHDIRVQVGASGVCHTDLSFQRGQYGFTGPLILGHEGAGTVVEVGSDVTLVRPGDRVIAVFSPACGSCWHCVRSRSHICERTTSFRDRPAGVRDGQTLTAQASLGSMAELMTLHELQVVPVTTDLPDEQLALVGCGVTTGAAAPLFSVGVTPGSTVAVIGCGGVGMSTIQGARAAGAAQIIAVDPIPAKREAALQFGATGGVDPTDENALEQIQELTDGRGVEYAFEVAGRVDAMNFAYDAVCRGGTVVFSGAVGKDAVLQLPANDLHTSNKRIIGTVYGGAQVRRDIPRLVALAEAGRIDLDRMITKRFSLDEANAALTVMEGGDVIRSVLIP